MHLDPAADKTKEDVMLIDRLRTDIVNELRTRAFVPSSAVIQWRRMFSHRFAGNDFNGACYERDIDEVQRISADLSSL